MSLGNLGQALYLACLVRLGHYFRFGGRYRLAERLLTRAVALAEQCYETDDYRLGILFNDLGVICKSLAKYEEAHTLYYRALDQLASNPEAALRSVATIYHNLGGLEHARGQYLAGEPFARAAVSIREAILGTEHPEVAADLAALGAILEAQHRYAEAEILYRRALAIFEAVHGPKHHEVASTLHNLGSLSARLGRDVEAVRLLRNAMVIRERLLGPRHPDVAVTLNNLAIVYRRQRRFKDAMLMHQRALSILEETFDRHHPLVLSSLANGARLMHGLAGTMSKGTGSGGGGLEIKPWCRLGPTHPTYSQ